MDAHLEIEYLPIAELEAYENNTRRHGSEDVDAIANSIKQFGFSDPVGIWSDHNVIVEGHGRVQAAKSLGMTEVPVIRLDHMTDEQRRAYGIAHNRTAELSDWDMDMLKKELDSLDLSQFGMESLIEMPEPADTESALLEAVKEDEVPDEDMFEGKVKSGQLWRMGDHFLFCGDSTSKDSLKKLMQGEQADLVVTDPPYNVAIQNSNGLTIKNDDMGSQQFKEFLLGAFGAMESVMRPGAAFYVWFATREHINFETALVESGLPVRQELTWVKNALVLGHNDYHWRSEPCLYGWKDGPKHYFVADRTLTTVIDDTAVELDKMKKDELLQRLKDIYAHWADIPQNVIYEAKPLADSLHPTMKPVKLIAKLIRNSSRKGEIVLDSFGGSGTTVIACEQLGRRCYTCELDERYASVIVERWEQFTGRAAELVQ